MKKTKKSISAILMESAIALAILLTAACFAVYYGGFYESTVVLWCGIVAFVILYQFGLRLLTGQINNRFNVDPMHPWFKTKGFEKPIYKALKVKKWKKNVPTYNPELFVLAERPLEDIAKSMAKVELDHWTNVVISLSTLLFPLLWGKFWLFFVVAVLCILFDMQFIAIQRFNRPRVLSSVKKAAERRRNWTNKA
ncbi:MAG: hypothetical protein IKL92_03235 [Oscillospiraceae bacterium]|nr:hypothetical protein [Oscillospiraceae bacterium]